MFRTFSTTAINRGLTFCAVAVLAAAQACSDSSTSPSSSNNNNNDPKGTYTLRTVDGKSLPHEISRSPYYDAPSGHFYNVFDVSVTDGGIELDEFGFINIWLNFSVTADGVPMTGHRETKGLYDVQGSQVMVTFDGTQWAPLPLQNGQIVIPTDILGKGVSNNYAFRR